MGKLSNNNNNDIKREDTRRSDQQETFEDDEPTPALTNGATHTSTFFSRLYNLRRGGGRRSSDRWVPQHEPAVVVLDEEDLMEKYSFEESDDGTASMKDVYLHDSDEKHAADKLDKYDDAGASLQHGRLRNANQEAPRRESTPGAFRVAPSGGPAPTSLHRYDSNADMRVEDLLRPPPHEDILVEASIVPPSRPEQPQSVPPKEQQRQQSLLLEPQHPVVEAKPMVQPPQGAITINKRRVIILVCVTAIVIMALAVGLGVSLTKSVDQSNSSQSSAFDAVPTASPTKPPNGGGGGGRPSGGGGGGGPSNNNRRLRRQW